MTEKEKMLSGMLYYSYDEELFCDNQYVKELIFEFNFLRPSELERRQEIIRMLFNRIGRRFFIEAPFRCDYGYNISIGENFYANYNCLIMDCAQVTIGNNVLFGPNVSLLTATHPIDSNLRNQDLEYALPITIGNSVWLGGGVIINPGITIGDNVVIGSGSVVTKDIPANCVAVGNPAKVIRTITTEDKQHLNKVKWKE